MGRNNLYELIKCLDKLSIAYAPYIAAEKKLECFKEERWKAAVFPETEECNIKRKAIESDLNLSRNLFLRDAESVAEIYNELLKKNGNESE